MKCLVLASLLILVLGYEDIKYSKISYEKFKKDIPLLKKYLDCFLGKEHCPDAESESVKPHLIEAFSDGCHECNDLQKHHAHMFTQSLKELLPEGYEEFKKRFDKDGQHMKFFDAEVAKY